MILSTYRFKQHCILLSELIDNIQQTQSALGEALKTLRGYGMPFIKNPLLKIQNELFELEYHLRQHVINCAVYQDLIDSEVAIDSNFIREIEGMMMIGRNLFNQSEMAYRELKKLYGNINERPQPSQVSLKNILKKAPTTLSGFLEKKKPIATV